MCTSKRLRLRKQNTVPLFLSRSHDLCNFQKCKTPLVDGETAITCNSISNEKEKGDDSQNGQGIGNQIENGSGNYTNANTNVGIATGNWGCGICGGDPQIKCIIQWIAASQVLCLHNIK